MAKPFMNSRIIRGQSTIAGLSACAILAMSAGCNRWPLSMEDADRGVRVNDGMLRSVKPLDATSLKAPADPNAPERPAPPPKDPFAGMERVELNIDQVRAWTLENNLNLKVALINPTIANQQLTQEEAKFDSVFFANVHHVNLDQPTSTQLTGSQVQDTTFNTGVNMPLITGGTATVELPMDRTETNNQFSTLNPANTVDAKFSISQPLLRNGWVETNTHSIRIQALQSQIVQAQTNLEVIRELAEAERSYWRLYGRRRALDVRQEQYELAKQQLDRAERRYKAQASAKIEVTRAESGLADRLNAIITAENLLKQEQRNLKRIMNRRGADVASATALIPRTEPEPFEIKLDTDALVQAGLDNRMEMLQLELQLAQDLSTIAYSKNQALPLFTMDYSYTLNGLGPNFNAAANQTRTGNYADWSVGANFQTPIGNYAANAAIQQAVLARLQRLATREAQVLSIKQEVLDAADTLNSSWQSILAARQASILAGRTFEAEQRQFDVGNRTSTDVLNAATTLADAQLTEILALTTYQISQVDLAFATGTLLGKTKVAWEPSDPRPVYTPQLTNLADPAHRKSYGSGPWNSAQGLVAPPAPTPDEAPPAEQTQPAPAPSAGEPATTPGAAPAAGAQDPPAAGVTPH